MEAVPSQAKKPDCQAEPTNAAGQSKRTTAVLSDEHVAQAVQEQGQSNPAAASSSTAAPVLASEVLHAAADGGLQTLKDEAADEASRPAKRQHGFLK